MRNFRTRTTVIALVAVAALGATALPASAVDTTATVTVESTGTLSIAAPATAVNIAGLKPGGIGTVVMTGIQVVDQRSGTSNWTATAQLSAFNSPGFNDPTTITYTALTATPGGAGSATLAKSSPTDLGAAKTVQAATAVSGDNTATWAASLTIPVLNTALAGDYVATLTHSVS
ncbi:hypothetical protein [Pengzhenrongella sp.]|jgi:hypothetical protein|uniref:hypothetical protein n=1 Tax=Pengzhenrongella sp. TaxID=2888820 RepID=UPI002F920E90